MVEQSTDSFRSESKGLSLSSDDDEDEYSDTITSGDQSKEHNSEETGELPFHYQYNKDDNDFLKEKKYHLRLKDLYKMLSKNQVCVLPDPSIRCKDGLPLFQIFTADFRERKKYQKFKNAYMAGDIKKATHEFMADILQP